MRYGAVCSVFAVALLISTSSLAWSVGKITYDPNAGQQIEAASPEPLWATDKRLDAKITYEAANVRLHRVIEDLAKMSGIAVDCGTNTDDWRVRDIPVTVAAQDISARNLLNYLVFSTHSVLRSIKSENGEIRYRIVADPRIQKAIDDYEQATKNYQTAVATWSFENGTKLKDIPITQLKPPAGNSEIWWNDTAFQIAGAKFLAALDPETRAAVLSSKTIWLMPRTAPAGLRQAAIDLLKAADTWFMRYMQVISDRSGEADETSGQTYTPPIFQPATQADLDESQIMVRVIDCDVSIEAGVRISDQEGNAKNRGSSARCSSMIDILQSNSKAVVEISKHPDYPQPPKVDFEDKSLTPFKAGMIGSDKKLTLTTDDNKRLTTADVLLAIAKSSGMTLVMEDFATHLDLQNKGGTDLRSSCSTGMPVEQAVLSVMQKCWMDKNAGALIGTSNFWLKSHQNLIPERLINNLIAKANGDGVDIDDLAQLAAFTSDAAREWISGEAFSGLGYYCYTKEDVRPIWSFYSSLSSYDKIRARSTEGLPLSGFDTTALIQHFSDEDKCDLTRLYLGPNYLRGAAERLADPATALSLHLEIGDTYVPPAAASDQSDEPDAAAPKLKIPAGFTQRHQCCLYVYGKDASGTTMSIFEGSNNLPYFSPDRTKAFSRALQRQKLSNKPAAKEVPQ